jgi:hypothetical protein
MQGLTPLDELFKQFLGYIREIENHGCLCPVPLKNGRRGTSLVSSSLEDISRFVYHGHSLLRTVAGKKEASLNNKGFSGPK